MFRVLFAVFFLIGVVGCEKPTSEVPQHEINISTSRSIGDLPNEGDRPTIAHVRITDLDQDGLIDILVCDVLGQQVGWIQQSQNRGFEETSILSEVNGAVHAEPVDFDGDGDIDVLVAAMGVILPTDAHLGEVLILENDGEEHFTKHVIAKNIQRVTDVQAGDLDGDGDLDLAVAQFGYTQGQVQWFRNDGNWNFTPTQLINRSGAIHAPIVDIDNDGDLDILALLSQEWETVYAFVNDGNGNFSTEILHDVADADFSSSGIEVVDLDQDGDSDVLWTNGDAFVAVDYRPLPTHGLQWLENLGGLQFEYHRIGQMDGAYGPCAADMDGDGDLDIVTVAEFAFWDKSETRSVVWWEQVEELQFVPHTIAASPTHLVTCDVDDLDGNGFPDIVAGGMALYPPFDRIARVTHWLNDGELSTEITTEIEYPIQLQQKISNASTNGEIGMILHANGFNPRQAYQLAMKSEPLEAKWPYYLGMLDVSVGDSPSALTYFEQAESIDREYPPLQTRLGELNAGIGNIELAKEYFKLANTEYATVALAQLQASSRNWDEVISLLNGVESPAGKSLLQTAEASIEKKSVVPYIAIDMGYQMDDPWLTEMESMCILVPHLVTQAQTDFIAGDIDSAERLLRKAISINQRNKDARLALASILLRADRLNPDTLTEALTHLEAGIESDPEYVMTRAKYGWALYLAKRFDEARSVWNKVLTEEPLHGPVLSNLAQLEYLQKNYQQAFDNYNKSLSVPEDSPFAISNNKELRASTLYRFALAAKQINKIDEAVSALQLAVDYSPSYVDARFELGNTLIGMKEFGEAVSNLEIANALQPNNPRILAALGYSWFNLGNNQLAIEFLEQAVQNAPTFALAWYHLGNAQLKQGNTQGAKESFSVAIQLQPTFTLAKEALSKLEGR